MKEANVRGGMSVPIAVAIAITFIGAAVAYTMATKEPKPARTPAPAASEIPVEAQ